MALDVRTSQQRAIAKMQALRWWRHVEQMSARDYLVDGSRPGVFYLVRHLGGARWTCDCPAGQVGTPCYHAAAAWRIWLRDQATPPPAAPAAIPSSDDAPLQRRRSDQRATRTPEEEALLDQLYGPRQAS